SPRFAIGAPNPEPFPQVPSKKGLQVQMIDDALDLGIHHAALNINLAQMLNVPPREDSIPFETGGHTYHFSRRFFQGFDARVKELSSRKIVVSLILLYYQSGQKELD